MSTSPTKPQSASRRWRKSGSSSKTVGMMPWNLLPLRSRYSRCGQSFAVPKSIVPVILLPLRSNFKMWLKRESRPASCKWPSRHRLDNVSSIGKPSTWLSDCSCMQTGPSATAALGCSADAMKARDRRSRMDGTTSKPAPGQVPGQCQHYSARRRASACCYHQQHKRP